MKNYFFALPFLFSLLFPSCSKKVDVEIVKEPISQVLYYGMLKTINIQFDEILSISKPSNMSLSEYKIELVNGTIILSDSQQNRILSATAPLIDYAKTLARKNKIEIDDTSSYIALGGLFSPDDNIFTKYNKDDFDLRPMQNQIKSNSVGKSMIVMKLNRSELIDCALSALGVDAIWALSGSSLSTWTAAAIAKSFSAIAKRALGPVGVAISVVSFGLCIAHESND